LSAFYATLDTITIKCIERKGFQMNASEVIDGIIQRKAALNMTSQQVADASGVPKSTVDKILRKETTNPGVQNVLDIADAVGYQIDGGNNLPPFPADANQYIYSVKKLNDKCFTEMRANYNMFIAEKNRWAKYLFILTLVLVIMLILVISIFYIAIS